MFRSFLAIFTLDPTSYSIRLEFLNGRLTIFRWWVVLAWRTWVECQWWREGELAFARLFQKRQRLWWRQLLPAEQQWSSKGGDSRWHTLSLMDHSRKWNTPTHTWSTQCMHAHRHSLHKHDYHFCTWNVTWKTNQTFDFLHLNTCAMTTPQGKRRPKARNISSPCKWA